MIHDEKSVQEPHIARECKEGNSNLLLHFMAPLTKSLLSKFQSIGRTLMDPEPVDAQIVYPIKMNPKGRKVFYIDVGTMPDSKVKAYLEKVKEEIRTKRLPTIEEEITTTLSAKITEEIDSKAVDAILQQAQFNSYNPLSMQEDFYFGFPSDAYLEKIKTQPSYAEPTNPQPFTRKSPPPPFDTMVFDSSAVIVDDRGFVTSGMVPFGDTGIPHTVPRITVNAKGIVSTDTVRPSHQISPGITVTVIDESEIIQPMSEAKVQMLMMGRTPGKTVPWSKISYFSPEELSKFTIEVQQDLAGGKITQKDIWTDELMRHLY